VAPAPSDANIADRFGSVARCTVERLMRQAGLQCARRARRFVTTKPDKSAERPPDRVNRDFTAEAPNRLWIVDFTYVPTWSGMAFTAFVSDVFSRRIVGWRATCSMPTQLPRDGWRWRYGPAAAPATPTPTAAWPD
jgi:putative transposase